MPIFPTRAPLLLALFAAGCCGASSDPGATSAPLVSHQSSPSLLAVGRAHVYWVTGDGAIHAAKKSDGAAIDLVAAARPVAIAADDARLYYATDAAVLALDEPTEGGAAAPRVLAEVGGTRALTMDASTLYVAAGSRVLAVPKGGGPTRVVADAPHDVGALAAGPAGVYFAADASVFFAASGQGPAVSAGTATATVRALAIDGQGIAWIAGDVLTQRDASGLSRALDRGKLGDVLLARGDDLYLAIDGRLAAIAVTTGAHTLYDGTAGAYGIGLGASTVYFTVRAADGEVGQVLQ